ncbi:MAG: hypothetical protein ACLT1T_10200 [Oscillospiraceae bacterium]
MDFTGFLGNDAIKRRLSGAFASGRVAHSIALRPCRVREAYARADPVRGDGM